MNSLMSGKQLIFNYLVYTNGKSISLSIMVDTGANRYTFINKRTSLFTRKMLDYSRTKLVEPIPVTKFNKNYKHHLIYITTANLYLDYHTELEVPFLELDIGAHDNILSRKWLEENDILINYQRRRLLWLKNRLKQLLPKVMLVSNKPKSKLIDRIKTSY